MRHQQVRNIQKGPNLKAKRDQILGEEFLKTKFLKRTFEGRKRKVSELVATQLIREVEPSRHKGNFGQNFDVRIVNGSSAPFQFGKHRKIVELLKAPNFNRVLLFHDLPSENRHNWNVKLTCN